MTIEGPRKVRAEMVRIAAGRGARYVRPFGSRSGHGRGEADAASDVDLGETDRPR